MDKSVLDPYGDFLPNKFYFNEYGYIPSELELDISFENHDKHTQKVLEIINIDGDIEVILEHWNVSKYKNDQKRKDFISYYFIHIKAKQICIEIEASRKNCSIKYWYNRKSSIAFDFVKSNYEKIRNDLGSSITPTFKVLASNQGSFYAEDISISNIDIDIKYNYNDDFLEIHNIIDESLSEHKSGLILLHGKPGTGKTTYIKHLLMKHSSKNFIFIPNDLVSALLQPAFISFLLTQKNSILVIEDAEKVIRSRENAQSDSVVSTILQLTDGLFSDYLNIKVICTFNTNISNIDQALFRKGRMIAFYEFKALNLNKANQLLLKLGEKECFSEMTVADIYYKKSKRFAKQTKQIGFSSGD